MADQEFIEDGAIVLARKIFTSEIWLKKPSTWKSIWIYILGKVNHKPNNGMERGEGFFNFSEERKLIGIDCTPDVIKKFLQYARESSMISTTRSTRGMIVKVLNYNQYQNINNYRRTTESTREAREKHERSTTINNNDKNVNNEIREKEKKEKDFSLLKNPKQEQHQPLSVFDPEVLAVAERFEDPKTKAIFDMMDEQDRINKEFEIE